MTKSTRHKKMRKVELKKIKMKIGRKLKGAQNEIKTDFKVQKIILREQLPEKSQATLITKKKVLLKELMSRLSHHNTSMKHGSLLGLKELIAKNSKEDIIPHLSSLFEAINPCLLDLDHRIRMNSIHIVELIILKVGNMIQPYFRNLASHLSCAMVHLNSGVQSHSLILMDVLLSQTPSLVAQMADTILENFFLLISRKINQKPNCASDKQYALLSNPSSRLASIKWRVKLFRSLSAYLAAILGQRSKIEASVAFTPWQVITVGSLPPMVEGESTCATNNSITILMDETSAKTFISNLLPLLFETFSEVYGDSVGKEMSAGTPLDPVAIELLRHISDIILHLWKVTEEATREDPTKCKWFMKLVGRYLSQGVLSGFPFCALQSDVDKRTKRAKIVKEDGVEECQGLNVNLASLSYLFFKRNKNVEKKILNYYLSLLSIEDGVVPPKMDMIAPTASSLLKSAKPASHELCKKLLGRSLGCYKDFPSNDRAKNLLLQLPLQATDHSCRYLWHSPELKRWMRAVVASACNNPAEKALLGLLLQFKLRNLPGYTEILSPHKSQLTQKLMLETEKFPEIPRIISVLQH